MGKSRPTNQSVATAYVSRNSRQLLYEKSTKTFWKYDDRVWVAMDEDEKNDSVAEFCDSVEDYQNYNFTQANYRDIAEQARRKVIRLGRSTDIIEDRWLSFDDCLLDPDTLETVEHPPDPDKVHELAKRIDDLKERFEKYPEHLYSERVASVRLRMSYADIGNATMPNFQRYLEDSCYDHEAGKVDYGKIRQLQEMAGYLLSFKSTTIAFILYGDGGTGKSVYLEVLRMLVSESRCIAMTPAELTTKDFNLPALIGKKANIIDEVKADKVGMDKLKSIIDQKPSTTRKMYSSNFTFRPRIKMYVGANVFPRLENFDNAVKRRFLVIPFDNIVPKDRIDIDLPEKISAELPAIVHWALEGLKRLRENRLKFTETASSRIAMEKMMATSSSVAEFLMEHYEEDEERNESSKLPAKEIYGHFLSWAKENGRRDVSTNTFGREAKQVIGDSHTKSYGGKTTRVYYVRKKTESQPMMDI